MLRGLGVRLWASLAVTAAVTAVTAAATGGCTSFGVGADASTPTEPGDAAALLDAAPADAPPTDAPSTDAPPTDAATCSHGLMGTTAPCTGCQVEQLYIVPSGDAGDGAEGPFIFGVATDGVHLYWLEQRGTKAYDGAGTSTAVLRLRLGSESTMAETLAVLAGPYRHMVINGGFLWVASHQPIDLVRLDRTCAAPCAPAVVAQAVSARSMVAHPPGVAVATGSSLLVLGPGSRSERSVPAVALARSGTDLAYGTETTTELAFAGSSATAPLLPASPTTPGFAPFGAARVFGGCDPGLWALQVFKLARDGGESATYALTRTAFGATATGVAVDRPAFALVGDTTHAYLGFADGYGLARWAPGGPVTPLVEGKSAWSLAMTDLYVYFDDHGGLGARRSVGIYRLKKSQ